MKQIPSEPKNHTAILSGPPMKTTMIYYKNYREYDYLPDACKADTTEREYHAWWDWYKKYGRE